MNHSSRPAALIRVALQRGGKRLIGRHCPAKRPRRREIDWVKLGACQREVAFVIGALVQRQRHTDRFTQRFRHAKELPRPGCWMPGAAPLTGTA